MSGAAIWWPAVAMAALTGAVWCRMFVVRIAQMRRDRIHPQAVATSALAGARLTDSAAADNFRNLFELPVLFYLALAVTAHARLLDPWLLALCWLFVLLRVAHSVIQCTTNRVMHRFQAHVAGALVLWSIWGVVAWRLWHA